MYDKYAEIRDSKGLSDYAVAKGAGLGRSTLSDWKNGLHTPNFENMNKIAAFLGVSLEYLTTGQAPEDGHRATAEKMMKDKTFWNYVEMFFFLPPYAQEKIFDYIEMVSDKVEKEKRRVSAS